MRIGITGGENLQNLIQRVRGTKAANFTDGIEGLQKNKAEALVRSSVAAVNLEALIKTYEANGDLFNGYQWLATLDSRTSDICKARSGLTWDMDFKPMGTWHWLDSATRSLQLSVNGYRGLEALG